MTAVEHVIGLISENRAAGTVTYKWTCSCGKISRRWYDNAPNLAKSAGVSHTKKKPA